MSSSDFPSSRSRIGAQVLEAEAAAEDPGVGKEGLGVVRQAGGASSDERPDGGGHHLRRVLRERPRAIDLADDTRLAIGLRQLLDDERNTLRLTVDRHGARGLDLPAQGQAEQRARLGRGEAMEPQPAHEPEAVHVGEEVDELADAGHLLRSHGDEDEDRPVGVTADDVSEQAQAVLVGPLEVVEEDREGSDGRQLGDGDRGQVVRAQELLRGRQLRQRRVVPARQHVDRALHGGLRSGVPGRDLLDLPAAEQRAGEHERPAQLFVRGQSERREPLGLGQLLGSHHQTRLADARLALDAHAREPAPGRGRQLLADRGHLRGPADELETCPDRLQRERAEPAPGPLDDLVVIELVDALRRDRTFCH